MNKAIEILGQPTRTFTEAKGLSHWWSARTLQEYEQIHSLNYPSSKHSVYAYPEKVDGGQRYNINIFELLPSFAMFIGDKELSREEWLKQDVLAIGRAKDAQHFRNCVYETAGYLGFELVATGVSFVTEITREEFENWYPTARISEALVLGNL